MHVARSTRTRTSTFHFSRRNHSLNYRERRSGGKEGAGAQRQGGREVEVGAGTGRRGAGGRAGGNGTEVGGRAEQPEAGFRGRGKGRVPSKQCYSHTQPSDRHENI
eukprot:scaffold174224_cov29-Tisochrysis_lutea.AAC.5